MMGDTQSPILLHGLFRCGSTYVFNKLRTSDDYYCYYEPLHHDLINLRKDRIDLWGFDVDTTRKVNHPALSNPHFHEYEACFHGEFDRLPYFEKCFSYDQYYKVEGNGFLNYIDNLISSVPPGHQPVLQFNRTGMRVNWFSENIVNSRNVSLVRNPRDQFDSYVNVSGGVFLTLNLIIITRSTANNDLARLTREFLIPGYVSDNTQDEIKFYAKISKTLSKDKHYKIFLMIWTQAYLHSLAHSDLVVNMNKVGCDVDYRNKVEAYFGIPDLFHDYDMKENTRHCMRAIKFNSVEEKVFDELDIKSLMVVRDFCFENHVKRSAANQSGNLLNIIKNKFNVIGRMSSKDEHVLPPIVTIVTPTYNQGQYIEETIKSVISQKGKFFIDYIVMDGLSSDDTINIADNYVNRINCGEVRKINGLDFYNNELINCEGVSFRFFSEKDSGQVNAINKGFNLAKGQILGWLNSDDIYYSDSSLSSVVAKFRKKNIKFIYGRGVRTDENGIFVREEMYVNNFKPSRIKLVDFILQPSAFWRRCVFDEIGPLNEELHYVFDWEYWIRISEKYELIKNEDLLSCYRIHGSTKTNTGGDNRILEIKNLLKSFDSYNGEARVLNNLD